MNTSLKEQIGTISSGDQSQHASSKRIVNPPALRPLLDHFRPVLEQVASDTDSDLALLSLLMGEDSLQSRQRPIVQFAVPCSHRQPPVAETVLEQLPEVLDFPTDPPEASRCSWGRKSFETEFNPSYGDPENAPQSNTFFRDHVREKAWFWIALTNSNANCYALVCLIKLTNVDAQCVERFSEDEIRTAWFKCQQFLSRSIFAEDPASERLHGKFLKTITSNSQIADSSKSITSFWTRIVRHLTSSKCRWFDQLIVIDTAEMLVVGSPEARPRGWLDRLLGSSAEGRIRKEAQNLACELIANHVGDLEIMRPFEFRQQVARKWFSLLSSEEYTEETEIMSRVLSHLLGVISGSSPKRHSSHWHYLLLPSPERESAYCVFARASMSTSRERILASLVFEWLDKIIDVSTCRYAPREK